MGGGHLVHIIDFTAGGRFLMKFRAVPGSDSLFRKKPVLHSQGSTPGVTASGASSNCCKNEGQQEERKQTGAEKSLYRGIGSARKTGHEGKGDTERSLIERFYPDDGRYHVRILVASTLGRNSDHQYRGIADNWAKGYLKSGLMSSCIASSI